MQHGPEAPGRRVLDEQAHLPDAGGEVPLAREDDGNAGHDIGRPLELVAHRRAAVARARLRDELEEPLALLPGGGSTSVASIVATSPFLLASKKSVATRTGRSVVSASERMAASPGAGAAAFVAFAGSGT